MTMTEAQWVTSTDPSPMFRVLDGKVSERKLRLFACAWWRSIEPHEDHHEVIAGTVEEVGTYTFPKTGETVDPAWLLRDCFVKDQSKHRAAALLRDIVGNPFRPVACADGEASATYPPHPNDCRCLVRRWLTREVLGLAEAIYEERAFDRMPILADALQEAECDNEDLLRHCRGWERCPECGGRSGGEQVYCQRSPNCTGWMALRGAHVRGCHAIDLLLGLS